MGTALLPTTQNIAVDVGRIEQILGVDLLTIKYNMHADQLNICTRSLGDHCKTESQHYSHLDLQTEIALTPAHHQTRSAF